MHKFVSQSVLYTAGLRLWGFRNVPMLFWIRPSVLEVSETRSEVLIPLTRRTKNHLDSMYIAVLVAGADLAAGVLAMKLMKDEGKKVSIVFKDLKANFLKRAEAATHFICEDGNQVLELIRESVRSGIRGNRTLNVYAVTPRATGEERVAEFAITLSVKPS